MNKKNNIFALALTTIAIMLSACQPAKESSEKPASPAPTIDQSHICEAKVWNQVSNCQAGQKVTFLPNSWGNQQLPILFAAANCDMRYSVALTEGGVVCIYHPMAPKQ